MLLELVVSAVASDPFWEVHWEYLPFLLAGWAGTVGFLLATWALGCSQSGP